MKKEAPYIFLGLLLVALAALFSLSFHLDLLLPGCQVCMNVREFLFPVWWAA